MSSSSFSPTQAELALVNSIFAQVDTQKLGILTGDVAVKVFNGANLPPIVLGEVWSIADEGDQGWLSKKGVAMALRLIAWAQKGEKVSSALLTKAGPLPTIDGYPSVVQHNTGVSSPASPPPGNTFPPLTPQDRTKFMNMFAKAGPTDGHLDAQKTKDIFLKSKLPNETLIQIWNLADTRNTGTLDATEFAIGMYFIQGVMTNQISALPATLPPSLYQQASGTPNQGVRTHMTGNGSIGSPLPSNRSQLQTHYTGQSYIQPDHTGHSNRAPHLPARPSQSTLGNRAVTSPLSSATPWEVSSEDKLKFDGYFNTLDQKRLGYIEGDVAVPFMLNSKLPEEDLAKIWDLADISNNGRLTHDTFAVAMHLIHQRIAGHPLPSVLPHTLIPPSLRNSPSSPTQISFAPEPVKDLFSWDDTPPTSAVEPSKPSTISHVPSPQASQQPFTSFSSPFGQKDLLSDDDDHAPSPAIQDHSAEIGNLQNQLNSTNRSHETVKQERTSVERTVETQATQLSALQTQLSASKAAYDTETKLLATLRERHATQAQEIQSQTQDLIRAESDLSAIRVEKAELEGAFLRDKEETRDLHRRMLEASKQAETLKSEVDKLKKDAKQQKGLLAIARKQLSTKEAEKARMENELKEAQAELDAITNEQKEVETGLAALDGDAHSANNVTLAASVPLPASPEPSVLSPSSSKSNNPFERLAAAATGSNSPRSQSPFSTLSASTSLPAVSVPAAPIEAISPVLDSDPFGFDQVIDGAATTVSPQVTGTAPTPERGVSQSPDVLTPTTGDENEIFATPITTPGRSEVTSPPPATSSDVPSEPVQLQQPLSTETTETPDAPPQDTKQEQRRSLAVTDLGTKLQELDMEDSESDSDDEVPLAKLAKQQAPEEAKPKDPPVVAPPVATAVEAIQPEATTATSAFDDIFGVLDSSTAVPALSSPNPPDASVVSPSTDKPNGASTLGTSQSNAPTLSGLNAFDAALGKISTTGQTPTKSFSFDTAFDDDFDFTAASNNFPPIPSVEAVPINGQSDGTNHFKPLSDFEEFLKPLPMAESKPAAPSLPEPASVSPPVADVIKPREEPARISGDLPVNMSTSVSQSIILPASPEIHEPISPPKSQLSRLDNGPSSPLAREKSPPVPARTSSPKPPRTSTSSSTHEKLKEPPTRHSKLSIRLPFGKKKKTQPEPMPTSHLTPPVEHPRTHSPPLDEDVEPVKQLVGMGFSRADAVAALERNAYDMPKALNSLLGAQ